MGAALVPRELTGRLRLWAEVPLVCVWGGSGARHIRRPQQEWAVESPLWKVGRGTTKVILRGA